MDDDDDNWDLQAVVRGCGGGAAPAAERDPFVASSSSCSPSLATTGGFGASVVPAPEDDFLFCFPDLFTSQTSLHELEDLCKPFFPNHHQQQQQQLPLSAAGLPLSSPDLVSPLLPGVGGASRLQQALIPQQPRQHPPPHRPFPQTSRSKRRKNQQKRVVCQVPADGLSSDVWAWRKYGQKPIKGSPYPRGYYRCSSSKGCLARKQVERSRTDPGMFLITYTAEHNHPVPTHRNSLAGSTRNKFASSSSQKGSTGADGAGGSGGGGTKCDEEGNIYKPTTSSHLSPTAGGEAAEDEPVLPMEKEEGEEEVDDDDEDMLLVSDMEMQGEDDMLFTGMEEKVHNEFLEAAAADISTSSWMTKDVS